jgi:hypothetical protein
MDPRENRPHTEIACLSPCAICEREEPREEEPQARRVTDRVSQPASVESEPSVGGGVQTKAGEGSPEGDNGETGNQGRRRVRDKRGAEATDSWCANWVKKAKA